MQGFYYTNVEEGEREADSHLKELLGNMKTADANAFKQTGSLPKVEFIPKGTKYAIFLLELFELDF